MHGHSVIPSRVDLNHFLLLVIIKLGEAVGHDSSCAIDLRVSQGFERDDAHRSENGVCELIERLEFLVVRLIVVET